MVDINTYLKLLTSEHNQRPKFLAFVSAICQASVDQQNMLAQFQSLFDVDVAVGDQEDKIGQWVGVSRKIKQAINVPTAIDDFERADGPLGSNWDVLAGALGTVSHAAQSTAAFNINSAAMWVGSSFLPDQFASVVITNGGDLGVGVRMSAGWNGYVLRVSRPGTLFGRGIILELIKIVGGDIFSLESVSYTPTPGDTISLEIQGPNLVAKVNNVQAFPTVVDSVIGAGAPGIYAINKAAVPTPAASFWKAGSLPGVSVLSDADYRVLLKLFIAMNSWDGTIPGIYTIWNTVFEGTNPIAVQDNQDMTMAVLFLNPPTDIVALSILTQGYFLLRPAGVLITGYFQPSIPGDPVFGFDLENATISGFDVGAWMIPINV